MRRDRYWGGRSSRRAAGNGAGGGGGGRRGGGDGREVCNSSSSFSGCMAAVFQFFDFQQAHFPVQHPQPGTSPEGDEDRAAASTETKKEDDLQFPPRIQIKTMNSKAKAGFLHDEANCVSPGTKTPTLVARLMGLDLLPDAQSPSSSSTSGKSNKPRNSVGTDISSCHSLPATPRLSLARRSDVDHRLSLQINKENNVGLREEFELSRLSFSRREAEEPISRSPGHYARQIMKQVKESVSRKVGLDITNTGKTREHRRDELLLGSGKEGASSSPRTKLTENKSRIKASPPSPSPSPSPSPQSVGVAETAKARRLHEQQKRGQKKVPASEKFSSKLTKPPQTSDVIRKKQQESFVRPQSLAGADMPDIKKKCMKSNPLSRNLVLNIPTPLHPDSPPATEIIQKQVYSCSSSRTSGQEAAQTPLLSRERETHVGDRVIGASSFTTPPRGGAESQYIWDILRCTGIWRGREVSFKTWFSASHLLDPCIFFHLEASSGSATSADACDNPLNHRCNRKLLFDVVDEILVEIFKSSFDVKTWTVESSKTAPSQMQGWKLMETLCSRIRSFPMSDCQFLEDIDGLIEEDLSKFREDKWVGEFEEEGEGLVAEIEGAILDTLIHENVCSAWPLMSPLNGERKMRQKGVTWDEVSSSDSNGEMSSSQT